MGKPSVENGLDALDSVEHVLDMLIGLSEALRLKGCGSPDRDECCLMLAEVGFGQVEALLDVKSWLETAGRDTSEMQTAP